MSKPNPEETDHELPELDAAFFERARPAAEVMGAAFVTRARGPGRPRSAAPKIEVKIRLDAEVVEHLRETGKGWQTRVNAELAKAVKQSRL